MERKTIILRNLIQLAQRYDTEHEGLFSWEIPSMIDAVKWLKELLNEEQMNKLDSVKKTEYYIQNGYVGNAIVWWRANGKGYTTDFNDAGRYSEEDAKQISNNREQDIAWDCDYVDNCKAAQKVIIDGQYLNRDFTIKKTA